MTLEHDGCNVRTGRDALKSGETPAPKSMNMKVARQAQAAEVSRLRAEYDSLMHQRPGVCASRAVWELTETLQVATDRLRSLDDPISARKSPAEVSEPDNEDKYVGISGGCAYAPACTAPVPTLETGGTCFDGFYGAPICADAVELASWDSGWPPADDKPENERHRKRMRRDSLTFEMTWACSTYSDSKSLKRMRRDSLTFEITEACSAYSECEIVKGRGERRQSVSAPPPASHVEDVKPMLVSPNVDRTALPSLEITHADHLNDDCLSASSTVVACGTKWNDDADDTAEMTPAEVYIRTFTCRCAKFSLDADYG